MGDSTLSPKKLALFERASATGVQDCEAFRLFFLFWEVLVRNKNWPGRDFIIGQKIKADERNVQCISREIPFR